MPERALVLPWIQTNLNILGDCGLPSLAIAFLAPTVRSTLKTGFLFQLSLT